CSKWSAKQRCMALSSARPASPWPNPNRSFFVSLPPRGPAPANRAGRCLRSRLPEGRGLTGSAFRTRMPCISNNYLADERTRPWHGPAEQCGLRPAAVLPLLNGDRAAGVLIFNSPDPGTFTPELVELLQRVAENVSFALANFDRA